MYGVRIVNKMLLSMAVISMGASPTAHADGADTNLRAELERIAQKRILFGHQSVGVNLLDGIKQLSTTAGIPISIAKVKMASEIKAKMIGHTFIAENAKPLLKLKSFEEALGNNSAGLDVAIMKLCYVDFTPETNVKALFDRYRATIEDLKAKNPGTIFVHVTTPLTTVQSGFKGSLKRLLGRAPYGAIENIRRQEYNELVRKAYQGHEPLFDLARVESTAPDGTAMKEEWNGSIAPAMYPAYTDDGGHLNSAGKLRAARELVSVLASISNRPLAGMIR